MKNVNQLKAGTLLSYLTMIIGTIIPLFYTPVMLRLLGQDEYGLYNLSGSITGYLSLLTLGLSSTIHRFYMRYVTANDTKMVERTMGLFAVIYVVLAVVTVIVGSSLTSLTGTIFAQGLSAKEISKLNTLIIILSINAGFSLLAVPFTSIIVCYERYIFQKTFSLIFTCALPISNLAILYSGFASIGMAIVGVVWTIIGLIINCSFCVHSLGIRPCFKKLPFEILKSIFSFTFIIFLGLIADMLYWATDKVLIGALMGTAAVAVYNIGTTFNSIMQQMASAISSVFGTRVNRLVFSKQPLSVLSELMIRVGRIQFLIISLVLSGFIVFGKSFIVLWVGEAYLEAYYVALLTMIPMVIPLIQNIAFNAIVAMNKHRFRSIIYAILAVCNAVSTYLLIPKMGIIGAAFCTFFVFTLGHGFIMNWFYYKRIGLDIPQFWKNILKLCIVPCSMIGICLFANIHAHTLSAFFIEVFVYTLVFCTLSWTFVMNNYEKNLIKGLFSRRPR